jgi:hypothetical protein
MRKYLIIAGIGLAALAATITVIAGYGDKFLATTSDPVNISVGEALRQLYEHNYNAGKLFIEGKIELFSGENEQSVENMPFKYYVRGTDYYQQVGSVEMINNKRYSLYIHHEKQLIQVNHPTEMPGRQFFSQASLIDSLMKSDSTMTSVSENSDGMYVINASVPSGSGMAEYRIFYSPVSYIIRRVEIDIVSSAEEHTGNEAAAKERIVITYDKMDKQMEHEESMFSEDRFIHKKKKKIELAKEFSNYQLLNLIP